MGGVIFLSLNFMVLTACHTVNKQEKDDTSDVPSDTVEVSPDTITMVQNTAMCDSSATMNGAKVTDVDTDTTIVYYYDTIIGRFRPGIVDTLIVETVTKYDADCYEFSSYKVYSPGGNIASPYENECYDFFIVNKGDLDGNGTDEIFCSGRSISCWSNYSVKTYRNGKWYEMIEPQHFYMCYEEGPLISKSDKPGYILAKAIRPHEEPFVGEWIVDSLMPILQYEEDTIIGRFRPGIVDTFLVEAIKPTDGRRYQDIKIYSPSGSIADIPCRPCRNSYAFVVNNIGDLDGNGTDEICIYFRDNESCWTYYYVITYRNGKWYMIINPIYINVCCVKEPLVSKSDKPGFIKAKVVSYPDPEDSSYWEIVDSLVATIFR